MSTIVLSDENLTLDDFLQLQSLLNHEQGECDKHIEACQNHHHQQQQQQHPNLHAHPVHHHPHARPIKFRRAISSQAAYESQLEKQRLAQALLTLQYLKEQYRRQRAAQIQAYLNEYRRQALISSILREEEERYYRQCIAAALEQRRVNLLWQQFVEAKKQEALIQQLQKQELCEQLEQQQQQQALQGEDKKEKEEEEEGEEEDDGYSEYHSQQLANLLKQIFAQQHQHQQQQEQPSASPSPAPVPVPAANVNVNSKSEDDEQKSMAEVWKYLNEQKADSETPRNAFLSSEQDRVLGSGEEKEEGEEEKESIAESSPQDEQQEAESTGSPASVLSDQDQIKALPPLQDHVVTLQDLIQKLAAEPVLVGEEYNKYDAPPSAQSYKEEPSREPTLSTAIGIGKTTDSDTTAEAPAAADLGKEDEEKVDADKAKVPFLPHHIFTEAEPTPTLENMPNTPLDNASIKDDSHFVDTVAAEQQNQEIPADPRKDKANEELDDISNQLSQNSDLVQRWNSVLSNANGLSFSKQPEGTLLLTASTEANRQFLGSEDEIMRVMLKLDSIDSLGDDDIRQKRKALVKKCEHMLEELDQVKKTQWEKVVSSNKQAQSNRRRRNKKKHHRK